MSHRHSPYLVAIIGVFAMLGAVGVARPQAPQQGPPPARPAGRAARGGQAGQTQQPAPQPTRDTSAPQQQQVAAPVATGRIAGRVLTADTARPVRGARVSLSASTLPGGLNIVTDASGVFDFPALPDGRYTLSVSKTGFITLAYGQRRPLQQGTPLQLALGQKLEGIEMRLPRGSAIAGHVLDENGDPMPNTMVRVMRYQYQQGERRLTAAGTGQTDDRGAYRVWGLNPGDYYVSAVMPNLGGLLDQLGGGRGAGPSGRGGAGPGGGGRGTAVGPGLAGAGGIGAIIAGVRSNPGLGGALSAASAGNVAAIFGSPLDGSEAIAYAPTYYPGVSSPGEARPVTVALGGEALDIDFNLLLVPTSKISGRVTNPDGSPAAGGDVTLTSAEPGGSGGGGAAFGQTFGSRVQADGSFSIANVPPARYILRARSNPGGGQDGRGGRGAGGRGGAAGASTATGAGASDVPPPQFASQQLTVSGDLADLTLVLAAGATITGSIVLPPQAQTSQTAQASRPVNVSQVRITAQATDSALGTNLNARVENDGRFTIEGVPAGAHWIRAQAPRGLTLTAVTVGGRDVIDDPYDVRSGERIDGVTLVFTDKVSEINGTITDDRGRPVTDYTVLAYPEDSRLWRPQARHIMTTRPDQNGRFQLRGLPPGRYYLATVDPAVAGEWFEPAYLDQHRSGAVSLSLSEGDVKTQDFKIR